MRKPTDVLLERFICSHHGHEQTTSDPWWRRRCRRCRKRLFDPPLPAPQDGEAR